MTQDTIKRLRDSTELLSRFVVAVERAAAMILVEDGKADGYQSRFDWARRCLFDNDRSQYYADRIKRLVLHVEPKMLAGELSEDDLHSIVDKYVGVLATKGL